MTEKEIVSCLSDVLRREITKEDYRMNPVEDLEMDSVLVVEFVIQIEDRFQVTFSDFSALSEHMDCLGDMIGYLVDVVEEGKIWKENTMK